MKKTLFFALCTAAFAGDAPIKEVDCNKVIKALQMAIDADESKTLELVAAQVAATPECANQIVQTAIAAGGPNITSAQVVAIVTAAINAAGSNQSAVASIVSGASTAAPQFVPAIVSAATLAGFGGGNDNPLDIPGGEEGVTPPPPNMAPQTTDTDP